MPRFESHPENKPGHRALRKGRVSLTHQIYHLTVTTKNRRRFFTELVPARVLARALHDQAVMGDARTLAWCLMPDHLHWLVQLGEAYSLSVLVQRLKSISAKRIRKNGSADFAWAKVFHDHALRAEEDLKVLARYIVANPVRAGLVEQVGEYPHWDVVWLL